MKRVVVIGEPLVESIEDPPGDVRLGFGGDALNLAVYLARSAPELRVMLATAVGDDVESDAVVRFCGEEGVDGAFIRQVPHARIGRYGVSVDAAGERSFVYDRSGSPFRGAFDGDGGLPDPAMVDAVCLSGITIAVLHDAGRSNVTAYAMAVRHAGGLVVFDPNHRPALWSDELDARTWTRTIAGIADVLLASTEDGRRLVDTGSVAEAARAFRSLGAPEVVVTDGGGPCVVVVGDHEEQVAVVPSDRVVDTTAAGDAFDAGFLAARLRGASPSESAEAGHALAARVVQHRGAFAPR